MFRFRTCMFVVGIGSLLLCCGCEIEIADEHRKEQEKQVVHEHYYDGEKQEVEASGPNSVIMVTKKTIKVENTYDMSRVRRSTYKTYVPIDEDLDLNANSIWGDPNLMRKIDTAINDVAKQFNLEVTDWWIKYDSSQRKVIAVIVKHQAAPVENDPQTGNLIPLETETEVDSTQMAHN